MVHYFFEEEQSSESNVNLNRRTHDHFFSGTNECLLIEVLREDGCKQRFFRRGRNRTDVTCQRL